MWISKPTGIHINTREPGKRPPDPKGQDWLVGEDVLLTANINNFFYKGDTVTVIADWGDMLYVSAKNGIHRVAVDKTEVTSNGPRQMQEITAELLKDEKCKLCEDDTCCLHCSFYDYDGILFPLCHDCGRELEEIEEKDED